MTVETKIYNLIHEENPAKPRMFVLINSYEINMFEKNGIKLNHIKFHYYESWNMYNSRQKLLPTYLEKKYDGDIYLLGRGPIWDLKRIPTDSNVHIETNFNGLKYAAMYSNEISTNMTDETKNHYLEKNAQFVELLKTTHRKNLFYCPYNIGIIGVEGYYRFHKEYYKYLDTIETVYFINQTYFDSDFYAWVKNSAYADKIKHLEINVALLFKTNPELIAYYRVIMNDNNDPYPWDVYLQQYYMHNHAADLNSSTTKITDQIYIGTDSYRNIPYYKSIGDFTYKTWFPEDEITHIINVSSEEISPHKIPNERIVYEWYPIIESNTNIDQTKETLYKATERLHEIISQNPQNAVFVNCALGVNRSPSVVLLYLILFCNMPFYEAYKMLGEKRRIFTNVDLYDILYQESLRKFPADTISPLKLKTHHANNFCQYDAYMHALYDTIYLEQFAVVWNNS